MGGALMLLAVATVFSLEVDSGWAAALASAGIGAAWIWPGLPARVPRWIHRFAFPIIVALFLADLWITAQVLPAIVRLDLLLLLYRGITYRKRRDDLQVIILGLFLIVVAGVLTVSLAFAAQILVFTACALGLLMAVTLSESAEGAGDGEPAQGMGEGGENPGPAAKADAPPPPWARHARPLRLLRRLREVADWRLVVLGGVLFVGVVAVSGLLFLAIPRFQLENSLFLERFITRKAKTGFNDSIKFGDVTEIQQDDGIALDVDVSDPSQAPANPYWRMVVLDEYENGGFRMSPNLRSAAFSRERTDSSIRSGSPTAPGSLTWTFYMEPGVSRYLPLVGRFRLLNFREPQHFSPAQGLALVALRDEPAAMTAYRVAGMSATHGELADPGFAAGWRNHAIVGAVHGARRGVPLQNGLNLPPSDRAALARLDAEALGARTTEAGEFVRRASDWLRRRHVYSLSPKIPGGPGDPLVRWMASSEAGHCELFAGALVLMARSAGLPARVVTGFRGGTWNGYSNNFTVRNSDAHAWAEIWDDARGAWLRADPLAAASGPAAAEAQGEAALALRMDRSWSARLESLRVFWYRRIVNFDQRTQADVLAATKAAAENSGTFIRAAAGRIVAAVKAWFVGPWNAGRLVRFLAEAAGMAGVFWIARILGHCRFLIFGRKNPGDPVRREAGRWLSRVDRSSPVVADLQRLRFGPRESWPEPRGVFRRARKTPRVPSRNIF